MNAVVNAGLNPPDEARLRCFRAMPSNPKTASPYPDARPARDRWIRGLRGPRPGGDPRVPLGWFLERERDDRGRVVPILTVLLRSRECPWRCVMCDLWQYTVPGRIPPGVIPAQLDQALAEAGQGMDMATVPQIKLYNAGSFFDAGAVPPSDYPAMARRLHAFDRVIVECHPALVNDRVQRFAELLRDSTGATVTSPRLEVAMGLETAHPVVLEKLNKRMTLDQFRQAADRLSRHRIALRVFVLVQPPFLALAEARDWAGRSVAFAFDCGATAVTLIPTRPGNGALDELSRAGAFTPPSLRLFEACHSDALQLGTGRGRVFADLWDLERFSSCRSCVALRRARLERMNLEQCVAPPARCHACDGADHENGL